MPKSRLNNHIGGLIILEILQEIGFERIQKSAFNSLVELMYRHLQHSCSVIKSLFIHPHGTLINQIDCGAWLELDYGASLDKSEIFEYASCQIEIYHSLMHKIAPSSAKDMSMLHLLRLVPSNLALRAARKKKIEIESPTEEVLSTGSELALEEEDVGDFRPSEAVVEQQPYKILGNVSSSVADSHECFGDQTQLNWQMATDPEIMVKFRRFHLTATYNPLFSNDYMSEPNLITQLDAISTKRAKNKRPVFLGETRSETVIKLRLANEELKKE